MVRKAINGDRDGGYGENIQILEGLEAVRVRHPGMYILARQTSARSAVTHLIYEVVGNSIDEVMAGEAGYCACVIIIHADKPVTIVITDAASWGRTSPASRYVHS